MVGCKVVDLPIDELVVDQQDKQSVPLLEVC